MRLKLYIPPHTERGDGEHAAPLHYYSDQEFLVETDKYVVEKVLDHKPKRATSREKKNWLVKYKGYPDPEWLPARSFMHDINEDWLAYNANHRIDVGIKLRRLKLHGQNMPETASSRHSEKKVLLGDPKTQEPKIQQKAIDWLIFIYFQENRLPGKLIYLPKNALLFSKRDNFLFPLPLMLSHENTHEL